MEQKTKKQFLINFLYVTVIGTITIVVCRFLLFRMFPFLLSLLVAAVSQKPSRFLSEKTGVKKSVLAMILAAGIYLGVGSVLVFSAYRLIISSIGFIEYLPKFFKIFVQQLIFVKSVLKFLENFVKNSAFFLVLFNFFILIS